MITIKYRRYLSACAKMLGSLVAKKVIVLNVFVSDGIKHQMALE